MTTDQFQRASARYDGEDDRNISTIELELFPKFLTLSLAIGDLSVPNATDTEALIDSVFDRLDGGGFFGLFRSFTTL